MNKKLLIVVLAMLILGLAGGGCFLWIKFHKPSVTKQAEQAVTDIQEAVESINQGVAKGVLPDMDAVVINPLEDVPDANPYKNTNPFSNIKTNPFE
ncbi:MAG: hypothetical protein PHD51_00760 [Patescibacteria group bacterium]|nr:hypothetical protein [Patescibacteria group bacterium]MDD5490603.1 hypothetical protein [Patescibacteria group bacterium]